MTLEPGARLGPYQIVAPLGAGGMGEVYRASDPRLRREVALKTLPSGLASDPERRSRFEQEARAASALNHPNIITVLDIGEEQGVAWIAMELVEGRTLRELLSGGPLATRKMLEIAVQLADGLAKAHGAGILHRDLKPDNVMVSKDGYVKILDFGLAKLAEPGIEQPSEEPTLMKPLTHAGVVLGTVGYMSPEQASGRPVDFRSDQFSLGTILFEMATGARPFQRPTAAETLAAIIREEPEPIARLNPRTPAPLRWIAERCLAKDPDDRYASTRDLARDLASLRDHLSETTSSGEAPQPPRARARARVGAGLALAGLAVGFGLGALAFRRADPGTNEIQFQRLTYRRGAVLSARFAPDGQTVAYTAAWEGGAPELYSVRFDSPESRSLGLPPADLLSISTSGEMALGVRRRYLFGWERIGTLARAPLGGGTAAREVLEDVMDADWAPDGQSLAVVRDGGEKRRLEFPPGKLLHETSGWISYVRVSPTGDRVAFIDHPARGDNVGALVVTDMAGARTTLDPRVANGLAWSADGKHVYSAAGFVYDLAGRQRRVLALPGVNRLQDVARDGRILFTRTSWRREIVGRAPGSRQERNLSWLDWSFPYDLSEDGTTMLFGEQNIRTDGQYTLYLRRTDGSPAVKLGAGDGMALSPDGRWALATTTRSGGAGALVLLPTGAGEPRTIPGGSITHESGSWFPDGRRVLVCGAEPGRASRLYVIDVATGSSRPVSPEGVISYAWRELSPDGRTAIALAADGTPTLYPIEGGEPRPLPGATRDDVPIRWTADGRGVYVQRGRELPPRVDRIDVASGERRLWKELPLPDPAGVMTVGPIRLSADGDSYVYSYRRAADDLMVATGAR
jgi:Tol biopolymer transport system component/predicted Ser/Thr protein kinase